MPEDTFPLPFLFTRRLTTDKLGRRITHFLSAGESTLPMVVMVQGCGGGSIFKRSSKNPAEVDIVKFPLDQSMMDKFAGKARILLIEKPGIKYLTEADDSDCASTSSETFMRQHALPRWAEAISSCISATRSAGLVDPNRTLMLGASEGGIVAAKVAAMDSKVTHVASLYGGGPSQLYDMVNLARKGVLCKHQMDGTPESRVEKVFEEWDKIQQDPRSIAKFWMGHTYLRWHSFASESLIENLLASTAKIFIAHGTADTSTPIESFDVMLATLKSKGRDLIYERVEGAEHGFAFTEADGATYDILDVMYERILHWFLAT